MDSGPMALVISETQEINYRRKTRESEVMNMGFPARFAGTCAKCQGAISRGDMISWNRSKRGVVYHMACPTGETLPPTETKNESEVTKMVQEVAKENGHNNPADAIGALAGVLAPYLEDKLRTKIDENRVTELLDEKFKELAKTFTKPLQLEVRNVETGEIKTIPSSHENMPKLLYLIQKGHHVYLYGPAGSGKSTAAKQVSDALDRAFGYISLNPQTPDSRLLGFIDAGGTYRATPFRKCFENGGVFCIDEMDNASPALLTTLNSMLENGHGAFPDAIVPRHKDFVLVATGNTNGKGGNPMFPERRPFDSAFSERFTFLFWEYDTNMEMQVTMAINPNAGSWLAWVQNARAHCQTYHPRVLISPRASFKGAEYLKDKTLSPAEIAEMVVFKGLDPDTRKKILASVPLDAVKGGK